MPDLIGLERLRPAAEPEMAAEATEPGPDVLALSSYFRLKRFLDVLAAAAIIILISPIWLVVGAITLLDIATPIFFWQQRLGQGGRPFLLQKFRTLKPPFDWHGRQVPEAERLSAISCASIDELPQLLNVLVGDMSLIGPRPLRTHRVVCWRRGRPRKEGIGVDTLSRL